MHLLSRSIPPDPNNEIMDIRIPSAINKPATPEICVLPFMIKMIQIK